MFIVQLNAQTQIKVVSQPTPPQTLSLLHRAVQHASGLEQWMYNFRSFAGNVLTVDTLNAFPGNESHYIQLSLNLLGGKGGFGSLLKAQGALMNSKKTTHFEACRDLQGRRLKTINEAQYLATYLQKEPERKKLKLDKINKKIEEGLKEPQAKKILFDDQQYAADQEKIMDGVRDAVEVAATKAFSKKVKATSSVAFSSWDEVVSSDSDGDEETDNTNDTETNEALSSSSASNQEPEASIPIDKQQTSTPRKRKSAS